MTVRLSKLYNYIVDEIINHICPCAVSPHARLQLVAVSGLPAIHHHHALQQRGTNELVLQGLPESRTARRHDHQREQIGVDLDLHWLQ